MKFVDFILILALGTISRADDLMDTLSGKGQVQEKPAVEQQAQIAPLRIQRMNVDLAKLTDPFQKHMYAQFEMAEQMPYDVQQWANLVLNGNYQAASHLWSVIQPQVPPKLQNIATAAQLYSLWKMGLNQTFFNQWIKNVPNSDYMASNAESNLEGIVSPHFDQWLIDNAIILNPGQDNAINGMASKTPMAVDLKAWSALRKGEKAEEYLGLISPESPMRFYLADTAALGHARKSDLVGVARLLKNHIQPIIEKQKDPKILSHYYLTIGRLLYQAGNLAAAKQYYEKIPNSSSQFLQAREELAWVLLRQGNIAELRGEMKTLSTPLFDEMFAPDIYVVRSISNLKMCFYDAVEKDFDKFTVNNRIWAKKIDDAIASAAAPAPPQTDSFSNFATASVNKLTAEMARLDQLGKESIGAALPAVGVQKHWKEAQVDLQTALELAKKDQDQEYRRQWKNFKVVLSEAIRKMRFVKVEYLTQLRQLAEGAIDKTSIVADQGHVVPASSLKEDPKQIVFPLDGEPWPDELFRLRSAAQGKCVKNGGAAK